MRRLRSTRPSRTVIYGGRPVELRRLEYVLLAHLARDPNRVHTKVELLQDVWDYRATCATRHRGRARFPRAPGARPRRGAWLGARDLGRRVSACAIRASDNRRQPGARMAPVRP
jgi:hypothetical protein